MHAINKSDDYHNNTISDKPDAYAALADAESTSETSDAETSDTTEDTDSDSGSLHGDAQAVTPAMPEAEEPDDGEAACPVCGDGLGATEDEVEAFIEENGEAYCEACGARLKKEGGA